jgi:hypothetical protein
VKPARAEAALLAALLLFVAGRCLVPMDETDLFFNLRLGEIVLGTHAVPRTNLLSFTFPGAPDPNLAWLFQVLLALVHRAAGIPGTVVLKTAFVVATFAILFRVARRRGAHPAAAAAALALAAWAAEPRFVERPHLVTFLGLACTLLALERAEDGRPRALAALVPCGLVWANANSCFFLAPAVLLLYAAGALLDGRRADARRAALVAGALAPLVLATPSGLGALRYIANHFRMPSLRPLQEYRHAAWPVDGPFVFLAALLLAAIWVRRGPWRQVLPALALGALGALRIRFVAEFSLLAGPVVAAAAAAAVPAAVGERRARVGAADAASTLVTLAALVGLAVVPRALAARDGARWLDLRMEPDLVPAAAIRFADESGLRDGMYNDLEVGSYLTWEGWPRHRVFQDPRVNGYPDEMHAVLRRTDLPRDEWEHFLTRFGVTAALITYPDENPRAALFDPERWALVYRAPDGLVFARRDPERAALAAARELPVTFGRAADGGVEARALEARPAASPVSDCVWRQRLGDFLVEAGDDRRARDAYAGALPCLPGPARAAAALALGDAALRMGDRAAAAAAYAGLDDPAARTRRGLALLALGRAGEALADLAAARRDRPADPDARLGEALALSALGRDAEARLALRAFLALAPGHAGAARARAELARLGASGP